ncbi:MAG: alpha/beta hydrolase [Cyclobacteriaceae bacterium]
MRVRTKTLLLLAVAVLNCCGPNQSKRLQQEVKFEPFTFQNSSDSIEVQLGKILVPLDRSKKDGLKISLVFMKIEGSGKTSSPIFFLEGGPGSAAIKPNRYKLYKALSAFGDVIVVDQRGTGRSEPDLSCPSFRHRSFDPPIAQESEMEIQKSLAEECWEYFEKKGLDLSSLNTLESAFDIDDVRQALGYEKITIVGMSYGSHLGLSLIKNFEESIDKVILAGVEGYDHTYKLPSIFDKHLKIISDLIAQDSMASTVFPNFEKFVIDQIASLEKRPVVISIGNEGESKDVSITSFLFARDVAGMIGRKEFISSVLTDYGAITKGDYSRFAQYIYNSYYVRKISIRPLSLCMDCTSNASATRLDRINQEKSTSTFAEVVNFPFPEICDTWAVRKLPKDFREKLGSELPTLFISGSLDGRTPYENVREIASGFPNSSFITVQNMGHNTTGLFLEPEGVMETIEKFLNNKFSGSVSHSTEKVQFE